MSKIQRRRQQQRVVSGFKKGLAYILIGTSLAIPLTHYLYNNSEGGRVQNAINSIDAKFEKFDRISEKLQELRKLEVFKNSSTHGYASNLLIFDYTLLKETLRLFNANSNYDDHSSVQYILSNTDTIDKNLQTLEARLDDEISRFNDYENSSSLQGEISRLYNPLAYQFDKYSELSNKESLTQEEEVTKKVIEMNVPAHLESFLQLYVETTKFQFQNLYGADDINISINNSPKFYSEKIHDFVAIEMKNNVIVDFNPVLLYCPYQNISDFKGPIKDNMELLLILSRFKENYDYLTNQHKDHPDKLAQINQMYMRDLTILKNYYPYFAQINGSLKNEYGDFSPGDFVTYSDSFSSSGIIEKFKPTKRTILGDISFPQINDTSNFSFGKEFLAKLEKEDTNER